MHLLERRKGEKSLVGPYPFAEVFLYRCRGFGQKEPYNRRPTMQELTFLPSSSPGSCCAQFADLSRCLRKPGHVPQCDLGGILGLFGVSIRLAL